MHSSSTTELGEPGENVDVFALASSINCVIHIYDAKYLDGNDKSWPLKICPEVMPSDIPIVLIRHMDNHYNSARVTMASAPRGSPASSSYSSSSSKSPASKTSSYSLRASPSSVSSHADPVSNHVTLGNIILPLKAKGSASASSSRGKSTATTSTSENYVLGDHNLKPPPYVHGGSENYDLDNYSLNPPPHIHRRRTAMAPAATVTAPRNERPVGLPVSPSDTNESEVFYDTDCWVNNEEAEEESDEAERDGKKRVSSSSNSSSESGDSSSESGDSSSISSEESGASDS